MTNTVSIIIPAFNAADYIEACIGSALNQTVRDIEVIVVDDGSSDSTAELVSSVRDSRVRLIQQANRGQSAALNRGAAESKGGYLKFLDADDWLNEEHIAAQLAALERSDGAVASCRWGYFLDAPEFPRVPAEATHRNYDDPIEWIVDSLTADEGMMGGWMWLIPRCVWNSSGGWDERLSLNNDFDFSIRVLLASSGVRFAPGATYSYRKGLEGALNATRGPAAMRSAFLTTESGCTRLLGRENSERIRRICADRWQYWLHQLYPEYVDLAEAAERNIEALGGSRVPLPGGLLLRALVPVLGWKRVRRFQVRAYRTGWRRVVQWKSGRRLKALENSGASEG